MTRFQFASTAFLAIAFCFCTMLVKAQSVGRAQVEKEIDALREQISAKEPLLFAISAEDQKQYAEFLQQSETGIVRLLPRERFDSKLKIRGGGAYYSFTHRTNEYKNGTHIGLEQGSFKVGFAGYNFGFFADLGTIAIEEITLDHPALKFLQDFTPPLTEPEVRAQQRRAGEGFKIDDVSYRSHLPVKVEHSYVLRSIYYNDSDLLVAIQVLRQDEDGSVVLVWKVLKKFSAPIPERSKQG